MSACGPTCPRCHGSGKIILKATIRQGVRKVTNYANVGTEERKQLIEADKVETFAYTTDCPRREMREAFQLTRTPVKFTDRP